MNTGLLPCVLNFISRIGADDMDTNEIRLRKALMVAGAFMFIASRPVDFRIGIKGKGEMEVWHVLGMASQN